MDGKLLANITRKIYAQLNVRSGTSRRNSIFGCKIIENRIKIVYSAMNQNNLNSFTFWGWNVVLNLIFHKVPASSRLWNNVHWIRNLMKFTLIVFVNSPGWPRIDYKPLKFRLFCLRMTVQKSNRKTIIHFQLINFYASQIYKVKYSHSMFTQIS